MICGSGTPPRRQKGTGDGDGRGGAHPRKAHHYVVGDELVWRGSFYHGT